MEESLMDIIGSCISQVNIKMILFLFVLFILISSPMFDKHLSSKFPGSIEINKPNTYGNCIKASILCILFVILDILVKVEVL